MKTDEIASKFLGKRVSGSENYDPSLLVAIPREENRRQYDLQNDNLPFCGWDVWHAYEFSAMTENGIPVTRLIKLKYSCNSEFLVESKSLKLYLFFYINARNIFSFCTFYRIPQIALFHSSTIIWYICWYDFPDFRDRSIMLSYSG